MPIGIMYIMEYTGTEIELIKILEKARKMIGKLPVEAVSELYRIEGIDTTIGALLEGKGHDEVKKYVSAAQPDDPEALRDLILAAGSSYMMAVDRILIRFNPDLTMDYVIEKCNKTKIPNIIGFSVRIMKGCDPLRISFIPRPGGIKGKQWIYYSLCGTINAESPIVAHMTLTEVFDKVKEAGIKVEIIDSTGYYEHRDVEKLKRKYTEYMLLNSIFMEAFKGLFTESGLDVKDVNRNTLLISSGEKKGEDEIDEKEDPE